MAESQPFDSVAFDEAFDAAVARCGQVTRDEARHFIEKGYVVIKAAFSPDIAAAVREQVWSELKDKHGVIESDPGSWDKQFMGPRGASAVTCAPQAAAGGFDS